MTPAQRQILRAHIQNASSYQPREPFKWHHVANTILMLLMMLGLTAILALSP